MSRAVHADLQTVLSARGGDFAPALCAEITRTDAEVFRLTSWARSLTVEGNKYSHTVGLTLNAIESNGDANVDQSQATLLLTDSSVVTTTDVLKGLWRGAEVRIFLVHADNTAHVIEQRYGWIGNITLDRDQVRFEVLGLNQHFQTTIGEVVTEKCLNVFCGAVNSRGQGCGLDIADFTESGTVTDYDPDATIGGQRAIIVYSDDLNTFPDDDFNGGKVTFDDEPWISLGIRLSRQTEGAFVLKEVPPFTIAAGMTFSIERGCTKEHDFCITSRSNGPRFRGFPHLKGNDKLGQFGRRNGS